MNLELRGISEATNILESGSYLALRRKHRFVAAAGW